MQHLIRAGKGMPLVDPDVVGEWHPLPAREPEPDVALRLDVDADALVQCAIFGKVKLTTALAYRFHRRERDLLRLYVGFSRK